MARNKVVDRAREPSQQNETAADPRVLDDFPGQEQSPSHVIAQEELLRAVHEQLTDEERHIAEQRAAGREWAAIAADLGGTADGVRKKLVGRSRHRLSPERRLPPLHPPPHRLAQPSAAPSL